jgi:hypothetical protein
MPVGRMIRIATLNALLRCDATGYVEHAEWQGGFRSFVRPGLYPSAGSYISSLFVACSGLEFPKPPTTYIFPR